MPRYLHKEGRQPPGRLGLPNFPECLPSGLRKKVSGAAKLHGLSKNQELRLLSEVHRKHLTPMELEILVDTASTIELKDIATSLHRRNPEKRQEFRRTVLWPMVGRKPE